MKLSYAFTLDDYKSALRIHMRRTIGRRARVVLLRVVLPILAVTGLVSILIFKIRAESELASDYIDVVGGLLLLSIVLPIARIIDVCICFKRLLRALHGVSTVTLDIGDDCIISGIPGVSEGKLYWKGIAGFAQDEKVTMLYIDKRRFFFFPTSALSPIQRTELNDLVARHITKR